MQTPTMLYRCPGAESFEGVACETTIVDEADVPAKLEEGWHLNWIEAGAAHQEAAAKLQANEDEQARIEQQLKGADTGSGAAGGLKAVHKGRGVWEVQDADGNVVKSGLTKEEAAAAAGG